MLCVCVCVFEKEKNKGKLLEKMSANEDALGDFNGDFQNYSVHFVVCWVLVGSFLRVLNLPTVRLTGSIAGLLVRVEAVLKPGKVVRLFGGIANDGRPLTPVAPVQVIHVRCGAISGRVRAIVVAAEDTSGVEKRQLWGPAVAAGDCLLADAGEDA